MGLFIFLSVQLHLTIYHKVSGEKSVERTNDLHTLFHFGGVLDLIGLNAAAEVYRVRVKPRNGLFQVVRPQAAREEIGT